MNNETGIRLSFFCGVFAVIALWELMAPRRKLTTDKGARWFANLAMVALDTAIVRLLFPTLPVGIALIAEQRDWGILNTMDIPLSAKVIAGVVMLDFVIYLQHVLFHNLPVLWRIHRMHHTDLDLDVTSGNRFHPLEIILSLGIKLGAVILTGAPALAVLAFEIILNATSMFNHGNIRIPQPVDRWLRQLLVTPDMHRVHHSIIPRETNSNYGFNLSWWDRLCGTYRDQPDEGHEGMTIGLREFRDPRALTLHRLLIMPLKLK
ncbi:sterol desaturase family protein [Geomobilimonas luticola]|uniref:Sterol desaturase family protein n=1 Tax=Geomobilimonas luticola TaxID=1114878 RepID=A0ABS5SFC5_9BACT|nr:sterol desaturase family protein [Geomobilimonas luticola]MBT0654063.1 sterol desaturase family protein [Geomobilimonas luticola]